MDVIVYANLDWAAKKCKVIKHMVFPKLLNEIVIGLVSFLEKFNVH